MSNKLFHVPSTSSLRPDICPSRSSLDSGFESSNTKNSILSSPCTSEESLSTVSIKKHVEHPNTPFKKPKLELSLDSPTSSLTDVKSKPVDLATKLINSCTSPKSIANVKRLLLYCTPSTSSVPIHGKTADLKTFIAEKFGKKNEENDQVEQATAKKGTFGNLKCLWEKCKNCYVNNNDLYDHVIDDHLPLLHSRIVNNCSNDELFTCKWDECDMSISRGDAMKKHDWLAKHVTLKHMSNAQPYKCIFENCVARFRNTNQLTAHCKNVHSENKLSNNNHNSKCKKNSEKSNEYDKNCNNNKDKNSPFQYMYKKKIPVNQMTDNIDRRMFDWFHELQTEAFNMKYPCLQLININDNSTIKGSKKRKLHKQHIISIVDEHEISENNVLLNSNDVKTTMTTKEVRSYIKNIFPNIKRQKCKPQIISLNGVSCKLVKKSLINKKIDNKKMKTFNAKDHPKTTDLTFGDDGKKIIDYWIKLDDEKYGKLQ